MQERVTSAYEHTLQAVYLGIGDRGICVDTEALEESSKIVDAEIARNLAIASGQWSCIVFVGADNAPDDPEDLEEADEDLEGEALEPSGSAVNLNATQGKYSLMGKLRELGYNVPKIPKKNEDGDYEQRFSAGELAIQKMLLENQFNYPGGDPALKAILKVREYGKLKSSYLNARLYRSGILWLFLSNYNVAGTLSGRRSSKRHTYGYGNNAQNFPKHSDISKLFRKCLVARPGNVLLSVDQIQAEDWPVSALSCNLAALGELRSGVDRHSRLASAIFNKIVPPKGSPEWNEALHDKERYLGKKGRHASNYGMTAPRFSQEILQEIGLFNSIGACQVILDRIDAVDPSIKKVFHKYVQDQISKTRTLITPWPFLRERQFLGCRPNDFNSSIFKEAYAQIPQSTVGDNTGFSVLRLETLYPPEERFVIQEGHDSIVQDVVDTVDSVYKALIRTQEAFRRTIKFYNGIEIEIPIEAEVGYSFAETVKIKSFTREGVAMACEKLQEIVKKSNIFQIALGA